MESVEGALGKRVGIFDLGVMGFYETMVGCVEKMSEVISEGGGSGDRGLSDGGAEREREGGGGGGREGEEVELVVSSVQTVVVYGEVRKVVETDAFETAKGFTSPENGSGNGREVSDMEQHGEGFGNANFKTNFTDFGSENRIFGGITAGAGGTSKHADNGFDNFDKPHGQEEPKSAQCKGNKDKPSFGSLFKRSESDLPEAKKIPAQFISPNVPSSPKKKPDTDKLRTKTAKRASGNVSIFNKVSTSDQLQISTETPNQKSQTNKEYAVVIKPTTSMDSTLIRNSVGKVCTENINNFYSHIFLQHANEFSGQGPLATASYDSLVSLEQLESKRKQFWALRLSKELCQDFGLGDHRHWELIDSLLRAKDNQSEQKKILDYLGSHNVTMHTTHQNAELFFWAQDGKKEFLVYKVPVFVINNPLTVIEPFRVGNLVSNNFSMTDTDFTVPHPEYTEFLSAHLKDVTEKMEYESLQAISDEIKELRLKNNDHRFMLQVCNPDRQSCPYHWMLAIDGPEDSLYTDAVFLFNIVFPKNYPAEGVFCY
jgi:hypothetical protein